MSTQHDAFELGMHSAFKKAGVKTQKQAALLFKKAGAILAERRASAKSLAAYELGLRKTAADHGLLTTEEQDAFVVAAQKVASAKIQKHQKVATLGAIIGALRKKDPGESRGHSIARSAATDVATTAGGGVGAGAGGLSGLMAGLGVAKAKGLKPLHMTDLPMKGSAPQAEKVIQALQRLSLGGAGLTAGAVGGAGLGAAGAYQLAKRKPQTTGQKIKGTAKDIGAKAKGGIDDLKKKVMHLLGK